MFKYRPGIDVKPAIQSLRRAYVAAVGGIFVVALIPCLWLVGLMPSLIFNTSVVPIYLAIGLITVFATLKTRTIIDTMERNFKRLGESRQFDFVGSFIPIMTRMRKTWWPLPWNNDKPVDPIEVGKLKPPIPDHRETWEAEWVPYSNELVEFIGFAEPGVATKKFGYWKKVPMPGTVGAFRARKDWLLKHCSRRFDIVETWWLDCWIIPELSARFGPAWSKTALPADRKAVADAHEAELLMGCLVASDPRWWSRRVGHGYEFIYFPALQSRLRASASAEQPEHAPLPALPQHPKAADMFLGKGFKWDTRHTQRFENMKIRDLDEVTKAPPDQGDPRTYGLGLKEESMVFCETKNFNQHVGIFGSTGVGKTRYVEPCIVQAIRAGYPIIVIDPKGDEDLFNRTYEEAREWGRGHHLRFYSLVMPKNPNCATYNPLNHYPDVTSLGGRVGSVITNSKDPFWREVAIKTSREVLTMCHLMREYLRLIDRPASATKLPSKVSRRVPKLLLMMMYAGSDPSIDPATAEEAVDAIIRGMDAPDWRPSEREINIVKMLRMPHYTPLEWNPTVRQVNYWGLDNTVQFMGWMLKIFNFHTFLGNSDTASPNHPDLINDNEILSKGQLRGKNGQQSMWMEYKSSGTHPLEALVTTNPIVNDDTVRWVEFFRYYLGDRFDAGRKADIMNIITSMNRQLESIYSMASMDRDKFLEQLSTLSASLSRFKGTRERIVCSPDPDITWERAVRENLIIYCGLGQLVDPDGANGIAKMMIQDIASFIGDIYSYQDGKAKPFFLICDEIASFINEPMIDLLNKGRGAGLHCVVIGQSIPDLEACLQDKAKAQQVMANLNTKVQLRAGLVDDAEAFSKLGGQVNCIQMTRTVGITPGVGEAGHQAIKGFSANESWNRQLKEVAKIPSSALLNCPRGQAFIHMMGEIYYVAQGMFPKARVNLKDEFHMVQDSEGSLHFSREPLFEQLLEGSEEADVDSYATIYALPPARITRATHEREQGVAVAEAEQDIDSSTKAPSTNRADPETDVPLPKQPPTDRAPSDEHRAPSAGTNDPPTGLKDPITADKPPKMKRSQGDSFGSGLT